MRAEAQLQPLAVLQWRPQRVVGRPHLAVFQRGFVCVTKKGRKWHGRARKSGVGAEWAFLSAISTAGTPASTSNGWKDFPSRISQIAPQADRAACSARMAAMCIDLALCTATVTGIQRWQRHNGVRQKRYCLHAPSRAYFRCYAVEIEQRP